MNIRVCTRKYIVVYLILRKISWIFALYVTVCYVVQCPSSQDVSARSFKLFISSPSFLDGEMFLMISFWCTKDDVFFECLHLLFGSLWNTDTALPSARCMFAVSSFKLVLVVSDRLI